MRVLVTGGCGYVGSHVTLALARAGHCVSVADDLSLGRRENLHNGLAEAILIMPIDIRDGDGMARVIREVAPDVVIHLAAVHFIPACERDPQRAIAVNVEGTQSVLNAASEAASVAGVVVASTAAVYVPSEDAHSEASAVGPTDIYGLTKLWTEQLAELFHQKSGKPIGVARLFNVFGPGETNPHLIPTVVVQLQRGSELRLGNLETKRDYVYVEDAAHGLTSLATTVLKGKSLTCNLGTGQQYDGRHIVNLVARLLGRDVRLSTDATRIRKADRPSLVANSARARDLLGWGPTTTLEDGLMATLERPLGAGVRL